MQAASCTREVAKLSVSVSVSTRLCSMNSHRVTTFVYCIDEKVLARGCRVTENGSNVCVGGWAMNFVRPTLSGKSPPPQKPPSSCQNQSIGISRRRERKRKREREMWNHRSIMSTLDPYDSLIHGGLGPYHHNISMHTALIAGRERY